ncbi:uncharacterized protein LOC134839008 [Symsagittifera roscoffensis]|uniref:uncharacterized protein LOC134839008 n=1 Tax=Symsagittifera roscoffensis TaxID=84072 RepID=UPI00307B372E
MSHNPNNIIRVNVSGRIFETYKDTLLATGGSSSKFHQLIQEQYASNNQPSFPKDEPSKFTPNFGGQQSGFQQNGGTQFCNNNNTNSVITTNGSSGYNSYATTSSSSSSPSSIAAPLEKLDLFFDRDPECFEHILFYLRTASLAGVRDLTTVEKLKVESEFYGLGSGFQELLKGKERILNMTLRDPTSNNVRKDVDMKKTYVIKLQIILEKVEDYVKWDIERNENIIRIAIGHRTQCSTHMRYQVTEGDTYNLQMTLNVVTRVNETNADRLQRHIVKSIHSQFNAHKVNLLSLSEITHCAYCERLLNTTTTNPSTSNTTTPNSTPVLNTASQGSNPALSDTSKNSSENQLNNNHASVVNNKLQTSNTPTTPAKGSLTSTATQ